jgi:hypothetical protein
VPSTPVAGAIVDFFIGGAHCQAPTDANGVATCQITLAQTGTTTLTASFAGTGQLLPADASVGFETVGVSLGHFVVYPVGTTAKAPKLAKFGPVTLDDATFGATAGYDVAKPIELAVPADANGGGFTDPDTHLEAYAVKRDKQSPKFLARKDVHVTNACGDLFVTASKAAAVLVPTAADPAQAVQPPSESTHNVDHFLCYRVKTQKKRGDGTPVPSFPKGVQVDATDRLHGARYDLKKPALICNPVGKGGAPVVLAGPHKQEAFPITPAAVRNPAQHLVCYAAKRAKKRIEQKGCGPAHLGDKGVAIVPPQAKPAPVLGLHVANQFEITQVDAKKEALVCIPSTVVSP